MFIRSLHRVPAHRPSFVFLWIALFLTLSPSFDRGSSALAGANADGVLVVHTDDSIEYTADATPYRSGIECPWDFDCPPYDGNEECLESLSLLEPTSSRGSDTVVWWVLAVFPEDSCPRLAGVAFGHQWSGEEIEFVDYGHLTDFELPSEDWPDTPGSGTALTWGFAGTRQMSEVYWFAGYSYYGPLEWELTAHPTQGAFFADDSVPSILDPIVDFGVLGLNGAKGSNPVEVDQIFFGCCFYDLTCTLAPEEVCNSYLGDSQLGSCDDLDCESAGTISVDTDLIEVDLAAGESTVVPVRIHNSGAAPLRVKPVPRVGDQSRPSQDLTGLRVAGINPNLFDILEGYGVVAGGSSPRIEDLQNTDVYQTASGSLTEEELDEIAFWVRSGGTLILEPNGSGQREAANRISNHLGFGEPFRSATLENGETADFDKHTATYEIETVRVRFPRLLDFDQPAAFMRDRNGEPFAALTHLGAGNVLLSNGLLFYYTTLEFEEQIRMAVQLFSWAKTPEWIGHDAGPFEIDPGQEIELDLTLDASHLGHGRNAGRVELLNTSQTPIVSIEVAADVDGIAQLTFDPLEPDFGEVLTRDRQTMQVRVRNEGSRGAIIERMTALPGDFVAIAASTHIGAGESTELELAFTPFQPGPRHGSLVVETAHFPEWDWGDGELVEGIESDIDFRLPVHGFGILSPRLSVEPDPVVLTLNTGDAIELEFEIMNVEPGAVDLEWHLTDQVRNPNEPGSPLDPDELEDQFTFADNTSAHGPSFDWVEISETGQDLGIGTDSSLEVDLPFDFPFYGTTKARVRISAKGYLTFGTHGNDSHNEPIPDTNLPNDLIAILWDDFDTNRGDGVYSQVVDDRFIIQYNRIPRLHDSFEQTFQVLLDEYGGILYQYGEMNGPNDTGTVGVENENGTRGIQIAYDQTYVETGRATLSKFGCPWLWPIDRAGVTGGGESSLAHVRVDANGLEPGRYAGNLVFHTNDPEKKAYRVPIRIHVAGSPGRPDEVEGQELSISADAGPFEVRSIRPNPVSASTELRYRLPTAGSAQLEIFDITGRRVWSQSVQASPGIQSMLWDATDNRGAPVGSGAYFYRLTFGKGSSRGQIMVLR